MASDTPVRAIRAKCLDCSGDKWAEVKLCCVFDCPLWEWRLGRRPGTARKRLPEWMDTEHVWNEAQRVNGG